MNIGILGGTFDPIHLGHLHFARAAQQRFGLERVYFIPARRPWHKRRPAVSYADRYAMVALALEGCDSWIPLAIERPSAVSPDHGHHSHAHAQGGERHMDADTDLADEPPTYSVDEVAFVQRLHPGERVFFLLGADALLEIHTWKDYWRLLGMCDFVVAARAEIGVDTLAASLPAELVRETAADAIRLPASEVFVLTDFDQPISSTEIRRRLCAGARGEAQAWLERWLPRAVEQYAVRGRLYACADTA